MGKKLLQSSISNQDNLKRVFSVDDGIYELGGEIRYLEGLQDGIKLGKNSVGISGSPLISFPSTPSIKHPYPSNLPRKHSSISVTGDNSKIIVNDGNYNLVFHPDLEDQVSIQSTESYTLRERQDAINETHPFGIRIWKPALYKKQRSVQRAANEDIHETQYKAISTWVHLTNFFWSWTIGILAFIILTLAGLTVLIIGAFSHSSREYSQVFFKLALYLFKPFGKVVYIIPDAQYLHEDKGEGISIQQFQKWFTSYSHRLFFNESDTLENSSSIPQHILYGSIRERNMDSTSSSGKTQHLQRRLFGRGQWSIGRFVFYLVFHLIVHPLILVLILLTWLVVFTIPMSNIMWNLMYHCRRHPLALEFKPLKDLPEESHITEAQEKNVLLCTFRCMGLHYYKFTVDGTNVIVMNLIMMVIFTILDFYFIKQKWNWEVWFTDESVIFCLCLLSIIPLAFYIGQAVASISAQTSMSVGAVINAFFSTIVEVFLYCLGLLQSKGTLVEGSMIGSILGAVLLLPGLSMCGGALNRKTQRYNPASAGVSCAMLIFSMIVIFVPTMLYQIYGNWELICNDDTQRSNCHFTQPPLKYDKMYTSVIKPISICCAVILFFAYLIGLWFTLRTHAAMIWQMPICEQQQHNELEFAEPQKHDAPNWSRTKSTCILLISTVLYAIIAEILVDCVDNVLIKFPSLNQKFLGLTVFALIPNTTEFLNAISFAIHGNVALSMEIGSAYALQVCLLQIPALVIFSIVYTINIDHNILNIRDQMFSLIFPRWDLIACILSVFLFTHLYAEGKSNYFKGSILILLYLIVIFGFYFQEMIDEGF